MMLPALFASLAMQVLQAGYHPGVTKTYGIEHWRIITYRDKFSDQYSCTISSDGPRPGAVDAYANGLLFHFPGVPDARTAWFRASGRPSEPVPIQHALSRGDLVSLEELDGSREGLVFLPYEALTDADSVEIRPTPSRKPTRFSLTGAWRLVAYARAIGCQLRRHVD